MDLSQTIISNRGDTRATLCYRSTSREFAPQSYEYVMPSSLHLVLRALVHSVVLQDSKIADAIFHTPDSTLQIRDAKIADSSLQTPRLENPGLQTRDSRLQRSRFHDSTLETREIPDSGLQTLRLQTSRLQIPDSRQRIPDSRFQAPDSRLQVPDPRVSY